MAEVEPLELAKDRNPWDRQPDEPNYWFAIFEAFRLKGPGRSLLSTYNDMRGRKGRKKALGVTSQWTEKSKQWLWRERAEAWDAHLRQQKRDEEARVRKQAQEARRLTTQALQAMYANMLSEMKDKFIPPKDIKDMAQAAAVIMKESRLEFGEPTERTDITTHGAPVGGVSVENVVALVDWANKYRETLEDEDGGLQD